MSNIVIFGAGGQAGRTIAVEALQRDHSVTGVFRDPEKHPEAPGGMTAIKGDATDREGVASLATGADAVVLTVGGPGRTLWREAAEAVVGAISELPEPRPRVIHLGGGATLNGPDGVPFLERPDFPAAYLDPATGQAEALDFYRSTDGTVTWTYFSPPPVDFHPGIRTGSYRIGFDEPVVDSAGRSALSYEDLAVAIVDEIERRDHPNERITAAY